MDTPPPPLVHALRRILRPLVRLMLARGVTWPFLAELFKGLFVEVARTEFPVGGRTPTDSRVSLLTGVHRKDVRRLRQEHEDGGDEMAIPALVSLGAQVVAAWLGRPPWADEAGNPLPLPRLASAGGAVSFEALVASRSKDFRARVVLDEWLRQGVVRLDGEDRVILNTEAFIPQEGLEEKAYFFALHLHDHAAAAAHNLLENGDPWLDRSVYYDALSPDSVAELHRQARQQGARMLKALNRSAAEMEARDAQPPGPRQRFTCGLYFYGAPAAGDETP